MTDSDVRSSVQTEVDAQAVVVGVGRAPWSSVAAGAVILAGLGTSLFAGQPITVVLSIVAYGLVVAGGSVLLAAALGRRVAAGVLAFLACFSVVAASAPTTGAFIDRSLLVVWSDGPLLPLLVPPVGFGAGAVIAWRQHRYGRGDVSPAQVVPTALVALAAAALLFWWSNAGGLSGIPVQRVPLDVSLVLAAIAAFARDRRAALLGVATVVAVSSPGRILLEPFTGAPLGVVTDLAVTAVTLAVPLGLAWWAARRQSSHDTISDRAMLVLANVLNVADAGFTWLLLATGAGEELNPVIDVIGLPGKVVLVGIGTFVLYRIKPRALRWAIVPLAAVTAYHVMGVLFGGL